jgi:DNA-binding protein YbaB
MDELDPLREAAKTLAERQSHLNEVQERLRIVKGRAQSEDGRITVEVGPTGTVEALKLDPRAMRMASEELAETIVALAKQATNDAAAQTQEAMKPLLGENVNWQEVVDNAGSIDSKMFDQFMRDMGLEPPHPPRALNLPPR